jgi:alkylation response protein AidB-like acyl-CoA dehydrogenase
MDFGLSEDQTLFQDALRGYLAEHVPLTRVRAIMEGESGHDAALVEALAAQGVNGVLIPEAFGGAGLDLLSTAVAAEELGRAATPWSFHSAAVLAPLTLVLAGSEVQRRGWLPRVAAGRALLAFAPALVDTLAGTGDRAVSAASALTEAVLSTDDDTLDGRIVFVPDAKVADAFVLATGTDAEVDLYLVPRDTPGVSTEELQTVDATRRVGELVLDKVRIGDAMRFPKGDPAMLARVLDAGRIALAADALGAAERALELAVEYAKTRQQFGRPIGSFQAVKHMCAETAAEIEPVRSLLWYAAFAWDEGREDATRTAALLKAHATEVATRALTTTTQVYGGMGFTYECDMHIWFKRVGYDRQMLGGPTELRARAAALELA